MIIPSPPPLSASRAPQGRLFGMIIDVSGSMIMRELEGQNMIGWLSMSAMMSLLPKMSNEDRMILVTANTRIHIYNVNGDIYSPFLKAGCDSNWDNKIMWFCDNSEFLFNKTQAFNMLSSFTKKDSPWKGVPGPTGTRMHLGISMIASMMNASMDNFQSGILTWMTDGISEEDPYFTKKASDMMNHVTEKGIMPIGLVAETQDTILDHFCESIGVASNTALRCLHDPLKLSMAFQSLIMNGVVQLDRAMDSDDFRNGGVKRQRSLSVAASNSIPPLLREASVTPHDVERMDTLPLPGAGPPVVHRQ